MAGTLTRTDGKDQRELWVLFLLYEMCWWSGPQCTSQWSEFLEFIEKLDRKNESYFGVHLFLCKEGLLYDFVYTIIDLLNREYHKAGWATRKPSDLSKNFRYDLFMSKLLLSKEKIHLFCLISFGVFLYYIQSPSSKGDQCHDHRALLTRYFLDLLIYYSVFLWHIFTNTSSFFAKSYNS